MLLNFCLIGKIRHNFLVPRMIESACKTFMPIPTLDIDRVRATTGYNKKKIMEPILFLYYEEITYHQI